MLVSDWLIVAISRPPFKMSVFWLDKLGKVNISYVARPEDGSLIN